MTFTTDDYNKDWEKILSDPNSTYNNDTSDWSPIYEWIAERAKGIVLDVGCGVGHLIERLNRAEKVLYSIGVDISSVAVKEAIRRNPDNMIFIVDAENSDVINDGDYDCVCFNQILEHIENDISLLNKIPKGRRVFISLPKEPVQEHEQHIRFFETKEDAVERYHSILNILEAEYVGVSDFICIYGIKL